MIRDYDAKELKKKDPVLYLQKIVDHDFWLGTPLDRKLLERHINDIKVEPLMKKYLQFLLDVHAPKVHSQRVSKKVSPSRTRR